MMPEAHREQAFEDGPGNGAAGSADTWTSTETGLSVAGLLKRARRVVVLTHAKPDGDAVGSTAALVRSLRSLTIEASAWYVGPMPRWFPSVVEELPHKVLDGRSVADGVLRDEPEPDAVVVCDTGAWVQLEEIRPWLEPRAAKTVVIDHHLSGSASVAPRRLLDVQAAAVCEPVADVCQRLLGVKDGSRLPRSIAEMLYLGLATDTGFFRFSNTRPNTLRLAASLMEAGVDHARLFALVEQQDRASRLRLLGRAFSGMELLEHDSIAVLTISEADLEATHADAEDAQAFATICLDVASVKVAATVSQVAGRPEHQPLTKISFRSKHGPNAVDVAAIARSLGGGGHARAAGLKLAMPLERARKTVIDALCKAVPQP
jgi:phosphoesterase RecJ-like protein